MYNRYIPQSDGSYSRCHVPDAPPPPCPPPPKQECPGPEFPQPPPAPNRPCPTGCRGSFLQQLLPGGFDAGDLIVILLLLLMAGECPEDRNNAILTMALYFLM